MRKVVRPAMIGAFVLGALVLAAITLAALGGSKLFSHQTRIVMYFRGSVSGLSPGAEVQFRGVTIGEVTNVFIRYAPDGLSPLMIPVFAEVGSEGLQTTLSHTEGADPRDARREELERLVDKGLRAQLAVPSLVTGKSTIALDFFPSTPLDFVNAYPDRVEIPTVPSTLQEVQENFQKLLTAFSKIPLDDVADDVTNILHGTSTLVNDPNLHKVIADATKTLDELQKVAQSLEARSGPLLNSLKETSDRANVTLADMQQAITHLDAQTQQTLQNADRTLATAKVALEDAQQLLKNSDGVVDPNSSTRLELVDALREAAAAARSLRELTEQLQRNPGALLFGQQ